MITTFEELTVELNSFERGLVPGFIAGFKTKIGPKNAISSRKIREAYKQHKLSGARIRKIIQYIRISQFSENWFEGRILVANSSGYFITNDRQIICDWIDSIEGRINAMRTIQTAAKRYLEK